LCTALRTAVEAKMRGIMLHVESVLPHFLLDKSYAERAGVEGMKHIMSPPLRDKRNLPILWGALKTGLIDTVGTDHCPFDTTQKLLGAKDFTQIPNGIPGIEDRVNLMYTYGVKHGGLDLHRFVDALSTRAAKLFGLFPRKGTIAVGSDADLVVYDTEYRGTVSAAMQHGINDYNGIRGLCDRGPAFSGYRARQGASSRCNVRRRAWAWTHDSSPNKICT
jgi:dihydropyrimidinase